MRFRNAVSRPGLVLLCAALGWLGAATDVRAVVTLEFSVDGGTTFLAPTSGSLTGFTSTSATFQVGGVTYIVSGTSNAPLGSAMAQISQVQIDINGGTSTATADLVVAVSDTNFTAPSGPATLTSSMSGAIAAGAVTGTGSFQSVADYNNNLFGGIAIGGVPSGNETVVNNPTFTISSSFQNTTTASTTATIPFALSNEYHIGNLSIGSGATLTLTGTTTLANVPEPATIGLALMGLAPLGLRRLRRRFAGA